jgi:hypothetical protein
MQFFQKADTVDNAGGTGYSDDEAVHLPACPVIRVSTVCRAKFR